MLNSWNFPECLEISVKPKTPVCATQTHLELRQTSKMEPNFITQYIQYTAKIKYTVKYTPEAENAF